MDFGDDDLGEAFMFFDGQPFAAGSIQNHHNNLSSEITVNNASKIKQTVISGQTRPHGNLTIIAMRYLQSHLGLDDAHLAWKDGDR